MELQQQIIWLFVLALPIACVSWTVTHEEVFAEPRNFCIRKSKESSALLTRKLFFLFTCEYCFSHYVTIAFLLLTHFKLLTSDWTGYLISGFSLVWIANVYMSLYGLLRTDIKSEKVKVELEEALREAEKNKS